MGGAQDVDVDMSGDEPEDEGGDEDQEDQEEGDSAVDEDDGKLRISASDSDDSAPEALADSKLSSQTSTPPRPTNADQTRLQNPVKERRRVTDCTEAGEESEYGVHIPSSYSRAHSSRISARGGWCG
jgi:U3 small nucleolar RNA-associated protein 14